MIISRLENSTILNTMVFLLKMTLNSMVNTALIFLAILDRPEC